MNFCLFLVALKYPLHPHESIVVRNFHAYFEFKMNITNHIAIVVYLL